MTLLENNPVLPRRVSLSCIKRAWAQQLRMNKKEGQPIRYWIATTSQTLGLEIYVYSLAYPQQWCFKVMIISLERNPGSLISITPQDHVAGFEPKRVLVQGRSSPEWLLNIRLVWGAAYVYTCPVSPPETLIQKFWAEAGESASADAWRPSWWFWCSAPPGIRPLDSTASQSSTRACNGPCGRGSSITKPVLTH